MLLRSKIDNEPVNVGSWKKQPLSCLINFIWFYFILFQIILDIIVTDGIVTRSNVIDLFYLYCIIKTYGPDVIKAIFICHNGSCF